MTMIIGENENISSELGTAKTPSQVRRERQAAEDAARSPSQRIAAIRERKSSLGGPTLKLQVFGEVEGFHLYWENDVDNKISMLLHEGFEFVTPKEVNMENRIVTDSDISDKVSKYVGTKEDGTPLRAYLMKCSNEIWEDIQYSIADLSEMREQQIRTAAENPGADRYQPKGYASELKTSRR